jgi:hypothetical protein
MSSPTETVNSRVVFIKEFLGGFVNSVADLLSYREVNHSYEDTIDHYMDEYWTKFLTPTELQRYASLGDLFVITKGFYLYQANNNRFFFGSLFLHSTSVKINEFLIAQGFDINRGQQLPPLFEAIGSNKPSVVEALLKSGADSNFQLASGRRPLSYVRLDKYQNLKILYLLRDYGADPNLDFGGGGGSGESINVLFGVTAGIGEEILHAFPNVDVNYTNASGITPLRFVFDNQKKDSSYLSHLLIRGANVDHIYLGETVLWSASDIGSPNAILMFLEAGADPSIICRKWFPLDVFINGITEMDHGRTKYSSRSGYSISPDTLDEIITAFIQKDKTFFKDQKRVFNTLSLCGTSGLMELTITAIKRFGINIETEINRTDANGNNLLMVLFEKNLVLKELIVTLLREGIDIDHKNNNNENARDMARRKGPQQRALKEAIDIYDKQFLLSE